MSVDNIKEYARRCASEPELREKAAAIGDDFEAHMRHAESLDLPWTMADATAYRREMVDSDDEVLDLSEDDLDQIAGGFVSATAVAVAAVVVGAAAGVAVGAAAGAAVGVGVAAAGDGI